MSSASFRGSTSSEKYHAHGSVRKRGTWHPSNKATCRVAHVRYVILRRRGIIPSIMPQTSSIFVCCIVLAAVAVGCADHRAASNNDAWFKAPDQWSSARDAQPVKWVEVKPSAIARAEQQLAIASAVRISPNEVADYTNERLQLGQQDECFLVRGLYLNRGTGRFAAMFDGRDLYVQHRSLGHHAVPMQRQPLLVALPKAPEHVYVSVSMAE